MSLFRFVKARNQRLINYRYCTKNLIKMTQCAVKWCQNNSSIKNKSIGITFHRFPTDETRKNQWISVIRKTRKNRNWLPLNHSLVCSTHFEDEDLFVTKTGIHRITRAAIPKKNLFKTTALIQEVKPPTPPTQAIAAYELLGQIGCLNTPSGDLVEPESSTDVQNEPQASSNVNEDQLRQDVQQGTPIGSTDEPQASSNVNEDQSGQDGLPGTPIPSKNLLDSPNYIINLENAPLATHEQLVPVDCLNTLSGGLLQTGTYIVIQNMPLPNVSENKINQNVLSAIPMDSKQVLGAVSSNELCEVTSSDPRDPRLNTSAIQIPAMNLPVFPIQNVDNPLVESSLIEQIKIQQNEINNNKKTIKSLNLKVRSFKKQITSLTNILKCLKSHDFAYLSESMVAAGIFNVLYRKSNKKVLKYSPALKEFCLTLSKYSPDAYAYTRKSFNACLPHPRSLYKWMKSNKDETSYTGEPCQGSPHADNSTLEHLSDDDSIDSQETKKSE